MMTNQRFQKTQVLALALLGLATLALPSVVHAQVSDSYLPVWLPKRVTALQPTPAEKRLDEIAWANDIRHALQLGKEHQRPILVFSLDGRINLGRC